jgi:hypothetical protein
MTPALNQPGSTTIARSVRAPPMLCPHIPSRAALTRESLRRLAAAFSTSTV